MKIYSTDLTDSQWNAILGILQDFHKRKHSLKEIFNAVFYLLKTGCQWRLLPHSFISWKLVYYYFTKWKNDGTKEMIHELLRNLIRKNAGKHESPSVGIIDSQSVKTTRSGGLNRGIDGGKKVKGRKRHIIVDSMGLILVIVVHAANNHDSKSAQMTIAELRDRFSILVKIIADVGYRGELIGNVKQAFGWVVEVVLRSDSSKKFEVLPKRWIVERTLAWFESYRRLSKDFEYHPATSDAMIQLSMIRLMLNRIKK